MQMPPALQQTAPMILFVLQLRRQHMTGLQIALVERKAFVQKMRCMGTVGLSQSFFIICFKQRLIIGMGTILMISSAVHEEICCADHNALLGDDDVDIMFSMVYMRDHRHDAGNSAFFGHRFGDENGQISITAKSPEPPIPFIILLPMM